jgi:hypothetical protein
VREGAIFLFSAFKIFLLGGVPFQLLREWRPSSFVPDNQRDGGSLIFEITVLPGLQIVDKGAFYLTDSFLG